MKKWMMLLLALVMCLPVYADEKAPIPVEIVEVRAQNHIQVGLETALSTAVGLLPEKIEQYQSRAEVVRMSDDTFRWVVTVFDLATLIDGWCVEIDAATGAVMDSYTTRDGIFTEPLEKRAAWKDGSNLTITTITTTTLTSTPMKIPMDRIRIGFELIKISKQVLADILFWFLGNIFSPCN